VNGSKHDPRYHNSLASSSFEAIGSVGPQRAAAIFMTVSLLAAIPHAIP
jgi:hypothetical protein